VSGVGNDRVTRELSKVFILARRFSLPSFMSTKRARVITAAAAGTLTLATVASVAGVTLSTSTAAAGTADAYLTSANGQITAAHSAGASISSQKMVTLSKVRAMQAEHQQLVAEAKAAAAKAAKVAKAKAEAAKAAKAKAAKARAAANAAVKKKAAAATPSGSPRQIAQQMLGKYGWSSSQFSCLNPLWEHESGWSVTAENPSSGAYGIPQALPGSQMATAGGDWHTNAATQIKWGLTYIQGRYGSPCGAWAHEQSAGWY
jgi:hypothetical protein